MNENKIDKKKLEQLKNYLPKLMIAEEKLKKAIEFVENLDKKGELHIKKNQITE